MGVVNPTGINSVFIGKTSAEALILWPPDAKSWLTGKDPDAGKDRRQEEKGTTEDEMVGWHHWLSGCEFEWTPGVGGIQGGLVCCSAWGRKESDTTEQLNNNSCFLIQLPIIQHHCVQCSYPFETLIGLDTPSTIFKEVMADLMRRTDSFEKTLMLGKIEGGRRRIRQRMRWLDGISDSVDMSPLWDSW